MLSHVGGDPSRPTFSRFQVNKPKDDSPELRQKGRVYVCDLAGTEPAGDIVYAEVVRQDVCLSVCLSVCLFVCLSACVYFYVCMYVYVYL